MFTGSSGWRTTFLGHYPPCVGYKVREEDYGTLTHNKPGFSLPCNTQTRQDFLCCAPSCLGSSQATSAWLGAGAGQCSRTELGIGNTVILIVLLPEESRLPCDQGTTQVALGTSPVVSGETLGRERYASPTRNSCRQGNNRHW